jgi:uracil-DNA glycosylase family 4
LGEGPGEEEVPAQIPMVGATGKLATRMLSRVKDPETGRGIVFNDFPRGNTVNCRTPGLHLGDDPCAPTLVDYWRPITKEMLAAYRPKVVFAMGGTACEFFLGDLFSGVKEWRGYVEEFDWGWGPFHVVFSYHPSFLMQGNFSLCEVWQYDFKRALSVCRSGWKPEPVHYLLHPTPDDARLFFRHWREANRPPLAFDIETPYSTNEEELTEDDLLEDVPDASWEILRISFAFKEKEAITMPWMPPYIDLALEALAEAEMACVWNAPFDCPRLEREAEKRGKVYGMNKLGLKRRGFTKEAISALESAFRIYQDPQLNQSAAVAEMEAIAVKTPEIQVLLDFVKASDRGIYR